MDPAQFKISDVIISNQTQKGLPEFNIGEAVPTIGSRQNRLANDLHSVFTTFTKIAGNHNLKFGSDYRLIRYNSANQGTSASGSFNFSPTFTQADPFTASSANTTGTALASVLLGTPSGGSFGYTSPLSLQSHYIAGFVQDSWKLRHNLVLNFGLRYELETPYTERYNRVSYGFDPGAALPVQGTGLNLRGGVLFPGVGGNPAARRQSGHKQLRPALRFRLAAAPEDGDPRRLRPVLQQHSGQHGIAWQHRRLRCRDAVPGHGRQRRHSVHHHREPVPERAAHSARQLGGLMAQVGDSLTFINQNRVAPYNQQWQISIQRELPGKIWFWRRRTSGC
jgi:hypothetical protein